MTYLEGVPVVDRIDYGICTYVVYVRLHL